MEEKSAGSRTKCRYPTLFMQSDKRRPVEKRADFAQIPVLCICKCRLCMRKIWSGFKGFLCNIKTLIYARLGELLSFTKKFLPFLTKAPLAFAKKVLLFLTKASLAFAKKALLFLTKAPLAFAKKTLSSLTKAPLAFAKKVLFFRGAWLFCVKKYVYVLFCLAVAMAVFGSSFLSCSPEFADQGSGNTNTTSNNNNDDGDDDDEDDPEDCEENEGDPCKDDEDCEDTCAYIYKGKISSIISCKERGDETVAKLEIVHDLLMGHKAGLTDADLRSEAKVKSDLAKISSDDEEEVNNEDFKCYLQIGSHKYIREIKEGLRPSGTNENKRKNLIETLKWFVNNKETAENLADLNAGDNILEALLLALRNFKGGVNGCLDGSDPNTSRSGSPLDFTVSSGLGPLENRNIWDLDVGNKKIIIYQGKTAPTKSSVTLDTVDDARLYSALSCIYEVETGEEKNIFSYSADKENEHIFDLAFGLLSDVCNVDTKPNGHEDKSCARGLMCWSSWRDENNGRHDTVLNHDTTGQNQPDEDSDFWTEHVDRHENALEKSGGTEYNICTAKAFADFF